MNKKTAGYLLGVVAAIVVIAAVLSHSAKSDMHQMNMGMSMSTSSAVETSQVAIQNFAFSPSAIRVHVGTTVTWTNKDSTEHSVVADTRSSDAPNGPLLAQGKTYQFTFHKTGTYHYHCMPHPNMQGTVVVTQ